MSHQLNSMQVGFIQVKSSPDKFTTYVEVERLLTFLLTVTVYVQVEAMLDELNVYMAKIFFISKCDCSSLLSRRVNGGGCEYS